MIVAGIDEAGFGPVLGPFVVGCCAVRFSCDEPRDCWKLLKKSCCATRDRQGRKLHVADSKKVYSPSLGLRELERSVLAFASCCGHATDSLDGLLACLAGEPPRDRPAWYVKAEDEAHPAVCESAACAIATNTLRHDLAGANVKVERMRAAVLYEPEYNRLADATRNKAAVAQTVLARHLDGLIRDYANDNLLIVCDRQGGRSHYGPFLRTMWPDWELTIEREEESRGDYALSNGGRVVKITFAEKGEGLALPTALASMTAKYLRERLMGRFNAWWRAHDSSLAPTAGYWTDGHRFLEQAAALRQRLNVPDAMLVRSR